MSLQAFRSSENLRQVDAGIEPMGRAVRQLKADLLDVDRLLAGRMYVQMHHLPYVRRNQTGEGLPIVHESGDDAHRRPIRQCLSDESNGCCYRPKRNVHAAEDSRWHARYSCEG